jgi:hypothetical protein
MRLVLSFACVAKAIQLSLFICVLLGIMFWFLNIGEITVSKTMWEGRTTVPVKMDYNSTNTLVITLQCNEFDILGLWLEYHSRIFGVENIIVLDNFSTLPDVIDTLKAWETKGVRVLWEQGPYVRKGDLILRAARQYGSLNNSQVLIPMDIDEFIAVFEPSADIAHPIVDRQLVFREINRFQESTYDAIGLRPYYEAMAVHSNDTVHTVHRFFRNVYTERHAKKMVRLNTIRLIDHGAHKVLFLDDGGYHVQSSTMFLGYLHYHHRGPVRTLERALIDCRSLMLIPSNSTLQNLESARDMIIAGIENHKPGHHKLSELLAYLDEGISAPLLLHPMGLDDKIVSMPPLGALIDQLETQQ